MTTTPATTPTPALDRFFATLRRSPVVRSQDRAFAGVSGGIAQRLGISRGVVRLGLVVLAIFTLGVPLYLLAWLMLPDSQGKIRLERAIRDGEGSSIALLVVTALSIVPDLFGRNAGLHNAGPWPFLMAAAVVLVGFKRGWWHRGNLGFNRYHVDPAQTRPANAQTANPTDPPAPTSPTSPTGTTQADGPQDAPRA